MGLLKDQALRLLREQWKTPTLLAEELYAILNGDRPLTVDGPITINNRTDEPAVIIRQNGGSDIAIQIERNPPVVPGVPAEDPTEAEIDNEGNPEEEEAPPGTTVFLGRVVSGSGGTYQVALFGNGSGEEATATVEATVPQPADDLPADTWIAAVHQFGEEGDETYEFQPPLTTTTVFLGRVVSGSGATYQVALFGNGSGAAATATVEATVPQIDPTAEIPADTWIGAVHQFGEGEAATYEFQPPIWL